MKIIDCCIKGQSVKFYLGDDKLTSWYGDDWDDAPYEHNCGEVYDDYVKATKVMTFPFDSLVLEPSDGVINSAYCRDDFKERKVPCIIVVPKELRDEDWHDEFNYWVTSDDSRIQRFYFGDKMICDEALGDASSDSFNDVLMNIAKEYETGSAEQLAMVYALKCVDLVESAKRL